MNLDNDENKKEHFGNIYSVNYNSLNYKSIVGFIMLIIILLLIFYIYSYGSCVWKTNQWKKCINLFQ
jgi:hypothetical protein